MLNVFEKRVGTQIITKDDMKSMIEFYNSTVEEYLKLGIGKYPFVDENADITIEELQLFLGVLTSKLISAIKHIGETEGNEEA